MSGATHGGKGDKVRPVDQKAFDANWDKIYRDASEILEEKITDGTKFYATLEIGESPEDRKLKEWGWMYDCLQNIHLYDYPVQEVKELLKRIKV
jgi:hypothetical protein